MSKPVTLLGAIKDCALMMLWLLGLMAIAISGLFSAAWFSGAGLTVGIIASSIVTIFAMLVYGRYAMARMS